MPYTDLIGREDVPVPQEHVGGLITAAIKASAVLSLARTVPMSTASASQDVLAIAPDAYWIAEGGLKETSKGTIDALELVAAEIAVVIPVEQNVFDDLDYDLWAALRPAIATSFAKRLDEAVLAGVGKPDEWTAQALVPAALAAGNTNVADSTAAEGGITNDLGETLDDIEDDGYLASGYAASGKLRGLLRKARSTTGEALGEGTSERIWDLDVAYTFPSALPANVLAVAGQWDLCVIGVRSDLVFKIFDTGIISDSTGAIVLNLMQSDKLALRVTARYAFNVATPATIPETDAGTPYPFSVLTAAETAADEGNGTG
jgi:HK97 family phage major capsid protein